MDFIFNKRINTQSFSEGDLQTCRQQNGSLLLWRSLLWKDGWRVRSGWHQPCWGLWVQGICCGKKSWHADSPPLPETHTPHTHASSLHPLPGSLEESTRTWLAHDECEPWLRGEVKLHLPLSRTVLSPSQQHTHLLSLQSYRDYRVKSTVWEAAVQMCGQPTEIPNSFAPPSTSLLQTNMPIPRMFLLSLTLFTGIGATCLSWDCYIVYV